MKKLMALLISSMMLLSSCAVSDNPSVSTSASRSTVSEIEITSINSTTRTMLQTVETTIETSSGTTKAIPPKTDVQSPNQSQANTLQFLALNDPDLLQYVEDSVYSELEGQLASDDYVIEGIQASYMPEEYYAELEFNSQENIYFGYKPSELNDVFQGTKYVFTLDEKGQTTVQEMEVLKDDTYDQIVKNVAIGTGVILVCVTVSAISAGTGATAISMIFAASAKTATSFSVAGAVFGGVSAGVIKAIETRNPKEAAKAAAVKGSEGFKWGAIIGAITGGAAQTMALSWATWGNNLSMNEVALIQKESNFPIEVIRQFRTFKEYTVYKNAGLTAQIISGKTALIPQIDYSFQTTMSDGRILTNLQRMQEGYAPIDPATGLAYNLHHIGQKANGTLAVLTETQHQTFSKILHVIKESEIDRKAFDLVRRAFWKDYAAKLIAGGL